MVTECQIELSAMIFFNIIYKQILAKDCHTILNLASTLSLFGLLSCLAFVTYPFVSFLVADIRVVAAKLCELSQPLWTILYTTPQQETRVGFGVKINAANCLSEKKSTNSLHSGLR